MSWYKKLGPGLLYAGAAIGVSHLVQATRAGSLYGFDLILIVLLINIIKYPFFEISARFVAASGKNLLQGYYNINPFFLILFLLQTFLTMFIVQSAVTVVTGGLLINFLGISLSIELVCLLLFLSLSFVLFQEKLSHLDFIMKPIMVLLVLCTLLAFFMAFSDSRPDQASLAPSFSWLKNKDLFFLAALIGWMPSPLDCSIWHSVWTTDKAKETKKTAHVKDILFDLRFSYVLVITLALVFLSLGALVMNAKGRSFSSSAVVFSAELVGIYRESLGSWSSFVVSLGCLMIMVSTTLSCWDAFSRVMSEGSSLILRKKTKLSYRFYLVLIALGSLTIINYYFSNMKILVDFATTVAFVVAPLIAFLSLLLVFFQEKKGESSFPLLLKFSTVLSTFVLFCSSAFYLFFL